MAIKKTSKGSKRGKQLSRAKKLEATKPLSSGKHVPKVTIDLMRTPK